MPTVMFGIDGTLLMREEILKIIEHMNGDYDDSCLTKVCNGLYAIHVAAMSQIFQQLLDKGIKLGFVTAANYKQAELFRAFESLYGLTQFSLNDCIYIDHDQYGDRSMPKGEKMHRALLAETLGSRDVLDIRLVDNDREHLKSAQQYGFRTTHSGAIPYDAATKADHSYLMELAEAYDLNIKLDPKFINSAITKQSLPLATEDDAEYCCGFPFSLVRCKMF